MPQPKVTIRRLNRNVTTFTNVAVATDTDHAKMITMLCIAESGIEWEDVKVAEYTLDGKHVFAFLRQKCGMVELRPVVGA